MTLLLLLACADADGDGYDVTTDCNDGDASVFAGAAETCDGVDQDCDGRVDEGVGTFGYQDLDGDGHGGRGVWSCDPSTLMYSDGDCDDTNAAVFPGAPEDDCADPVDYNCDGSTGYRDGDGDGFGACVDCNDSDPAIHPGGEEVCNGLDDDCDGLIDAGADGASAWYADADADGWGAGPAVAACDPLPGHAPDSGDCDDDDPLVYPTNDERCDQLDQDCDGVVDEESVDALLWYIDEDGDGYGTGDPQAVCGIPEKVSAIGGDCDDTSAAAYPGGEEVCDRLDNDCDGVTDYDAWVPDDYSTLQDAIAGASTGEHVCVESGRYTERLLFEGERMTLEGESGAVLDGDGYGPVVTLQSNSKVTLAGFTIEHGEAAQGAAIYVQNSDDVSLERLVVQDNECNSSSCRGAVHVENSDCSLSDILIQDNVSNASSTAYAAGLSFDDSKPTLDGVSVHYNASSGSSVWSAGIYADNSDGDWSRVDVRANEAVGSNFVTAAGVSLNGNSDPTITNFIVAGNEAEADNIYAVGVWCYSGCQASFTNGVIHGNVADGGYVYGSAFTAYSSSAPTLVNVSVTDNEASGSVQGTALSAVSSSSINVSYSNFDGNDSPAWSGLSNPGTSNGNLVEDPDYDDIGGFKPEKWEFTLQTGSALIDEGTPSLSDPDGSRSDVGAYGGPGGEW